MRWSSKGDVGRISNPEDWLGDDAEVEIGENVSIGACCLLGSKHGLLMIGDGSVIRSHTVVYGNTVVGRHFQTGHFVLIRENVLVGDGCSVGTHSEVGHHTVIGDNVRIHSGVFIPEFVSIMDDAWIGPCVIMLNAKHPQCPDIKKCPDGLVGPKVMEGAIVGAGAVLFPGVVVGRCAFIGAGSLVTDDVPPFCAVYNDESPARLRDRIGDIRCSLGGPNPYRLRGRDGS